MTDMNKVLEQFAEEVAEEFPALRAVMDEAAGGRIPEGEALAKMNQVLLSNPSVARRFMVKALESLAPVAGEEAPQPLDHDGLVMHKERGLPRLNPVVEAALIERAQFDDDIPELRTGGMPQGVRPAVSVDTDVRNPAALGVMLDAASDEVAEKVEASNQRRLEMVERVANGDVLTLIEQSGAALTTTAVEDMVFDGKSDLTDPEEYRRGQVPTPLTVTKPSGSALLAMTPAQRRQGAWKFLSTTQGRRTALNSLRELVAVKLRGEGFEVFFEQADPANTVAVLAHHEWTCRIDGPNSTQSAFNLIDIAAASIAKGLTAKRGEHRGPVILEVQAVNTVDIRAVGWAGRLCSPDPGLLLPA